MFLLMKKVYVSKTFVVFLLGITLALYYFVASDTKDGYWHYTLKFNAYYITPIYLILIAKRLYIFKTIVDLTKIRLEKKGMFKFLFHTSCLHIVLYTFITNIPFILFSLSHFTLFPLARYLLMSLLNKL